MQSSKAERIKKEVVKTKILATTHTDVEVNANDFKRAKSPIVILMAAEGGVLSLTIHHPVGVTPHGEGEWIATETEQYHYLEERAEDPKAAIRLQQANTHSATILVKEYERGATESLKEVKAALTKIDTSAKLEINSHGDIMLNDKSTIKILNAIMKECDEELDEEFYRKKKQFVKEKLAYDKLVRGIPVKERSEFNPSIPYPEKRSKKAIFEGSKYKAYYALEQAIGNALNEIKKLPKVIEEREKLLKSDYETLGGLAKNTHQVPIPGLSGMNSIQARDQIMNLIMRGPEPTPLVKVLGTGPK